MNDICYPAQFAYEHGTDPITYAEHQATMLIDVHLQVWAARMDNPQSFPAYSIELTTGAVARRIIGDLLDAGWAPPDTSAAMRDGKGSLPDEDNSKPGEPS